MATAPSGTELCMDSRALESETIYSGLLRLAGTPPASLSTRLRFAFVTPPAGYSTFWAWQPSIVTGTLWMFTATALLVVWYQIPVHDWQRAIMLGLVSYLVVFVLYMNLFGRFGWEHRETVGLLDVAAYLSLCVFWAWAAWRRDPPLALETPRAA